MRINMFVKFGGDRHAIFQKNFFEDKCIVIHRECNYDYLFNPIEKLENDIKNS